MAAEEPDFATKLAELRAAVDEATGGYPFMDIVYKRFLVGYKGVVDSAIRGMIRHWEWRKETNADTLTADSCSSIIAKKVAIIFGTDKANRPVVSVMVGRHDKDDRDINELRNFIIFSLESLMKLANPDDQRVTLIFDMSGFGLRCMDYEGVQLLISILQKNYPEVLQVVLVVNSPFIFWACWAVIKPWIDPVTQKKVEFIDASSVEDYIAHDQILPDVLTSLGL